MGIGQNLFSFFFAIACSELFSGLFPLLFLGPFTLATFCVSHSFWLS